MCWSKDECKSRAYLTILSTLGSISLYLCTKISFPETENSCFLFQHCPKVLELFFCQLTYHFSHALDIKFGQSKWVQTTNGNLIISSQISHLVCWINFLTSEFENLNSTWHRQWGVIKTVWVLLKIKKSECSCIPAILHINIHLA